jgi:putative DNA primase/helicase
MVEATGYRVAVAFNAGNLLDVALALRARHPDLPLILGADDDWRTDGNPGVTKATEATRAVGGLLAIPDFGPDRPEGATDFNDMAALCGIEAVRARISALHVTSASHIEDVATKPFFIGEDSQSDSTHSTAANSQTYSKSDVTDVTDVTTNGGAACGVTFDETADVTGVTNPFPGADDRPCYPELKTGLLRLLRLPKLRRYG